MRYPPNIFYAALFLLFLIFALPMTALQAEDQSIELFTEIAPGVYRGGQPTEEGYEKLKEMGVKTVVCFRHEDEWIRFGRESAKQHGLEFVSIPWTIYGGTDWDVAQKFFSVVESEEKHPVFIYCKRGVERTGVLSAAYHMKYEGLTPDQAYEKAFDDFPVKWIWRPFVNRHFDFVKEKIQESSSS